MLNQGLIASLIYFLRITIIIVGVLSISRFSPLIKALYTDLKLQLGKLIQRRISETGDQRPLLPRQRCFKSGSWGDITISNPI